MKISIFVLICLSFLVINTVAITYVYFLNAKNYGKTTWTVRDFTFMGERHFTDTQARFINWLVGILVHNAHIPSVNEFEALLMHEPRNPANLVCPKYALYYWTKDRDHKKRQIMMIVEDEKTFMPVHTLKHQRCRIRIIR